jgi:hypothetical protein
VDTVGHGLHGHVDGCGFMWGSTRARISYRYFWVSLASVDITHHDSNTYSPLRVMVLLGSL